MSISYSSAFTHSLSLATNDDFGELGALVASYRLLDIQTTETVADIAYGFASTLDAPHETTRWASRPSMIDKFVMSNVMSSANVPTPDVAEASMSSPADTITRFGLPVVLKHRIGSAGTGVVIIRSAEALDTIGAEHELEDCFFERFIDGPQFCYGALCTSEGVTVAATYAIHDGTSPLSPSILVEGIDAPEVDLIGQKVAEVSGMLGLMNLDLIRDADGSYLVNDVNSRAWASMATCAGMDADLTTAYIRWLRGESVTPAHSTPSLQPLAVFPGALRGSRDGAASRYAFLRWAVRELRKSGVRYVLAVLIRNRHYL